MSAETNGNASSTPDDELDPNTGLTLRQKRLIRESWTALRTKKDQKEFGVEFFMQLFGKYPHQMKLFPLFKDKSLETLALGSDMRAHATTVMYQIASFVENLDDAQCLVGLVEKVSRNHLAHGVKPTEFEELREMFGPFLVSQLGEDATEETLKSWDILLGVMNSVFTKMHASQQSAD